MNNTFVAICTPMAGIVCTAVLISILLSEPVLASHLFSLFLTTCLLLSLCSKQGNISMQCIAGSEHSRKFPLAKKLWMESI